MGAQVKSDGPHGKPVAPHGPQTVLHGMHGVHPALTFSTGGAVLKQQYSGAGGTGTTCGLGWHINVWQISCGSQMVRGLHTNFGSGSFRV